MNLYGYEIQRDTDLMHHGIKGQKWGIRRYQNADGTWTDAGLKRYSSKGDKAANRALKKGASAETASAYGNAVAKREALYEKTEDSTNRVNYTLGLSPKRWKEWAKDYKDFNAAKRTASELKTRVNAEAKGSKVAKKLERSGASSEKSKEVGKLYAERYLADKAYSKAYSKVSNSIPIGKKYKQNVDKMVSSLNDYYIADDAYRIAKIEANAEARRSKGWS